LTGADVERSVDYGQGTSLGLNTHPNPFNPVTTIQYSLPADCHVTIDVHDVSGRRVAVLSDGKEIAGEHSVTWDARGMPSGVYFCRLVAGDLVCTSKMVLLR
jgi:hypothetical protein